MPIGFRLNPIDSLRFLQDFTNMSPIFLKLVINLYMGLIDAYRIHIDSYRFRKISIGCY